MKSIFIKDDAKIEIKIFFAKDSTGEIFVANKKEGLLEKEDIDKDSLEEHKVVFKYPNHGDMTNIFSKSVQVGIDGLSIDPVTARSNKLIYLLKDWTFVAEDGKKLPVTSENINNLHPVLADFILVEFEEKIGTV